VGVSESLSPCSKSSAVFYLFTTNTASWTQGTLVAVAMYFNGYLLLALRLVSTAVADPLEKWGQYLAYYDENTALIAL
jgi:hypothetical protein